MTAPYVLRAFEWTARDANDAGVIAFALGVLRHVPHGEAVMESSIDLQVAGRLPRLTDAWRFFHAAAQLRDAHSPLAAKAQQFGARIALYVSGLTVIDMTLVECGATGGLGMFVEQHESPMVLEFKTEDQRTVLELVDADFPARCRPQSPSESPDGADESDPDQLRLRRCVNVDAETSLPR